MGWDSLMQGKGLLGMQMAQPPAGLLGPYYDPKQERQQKLLMGLQGAGLALLQNGKGSFGEVLGQAAQGMVQGANNAGINYKQDAMGYNKMAMDMQAQREKEEEKKRLMDWVNSQPPDMQNFLAVNPEAGAKMWQEQKIKTMFPDDAKAPTVDTFYDEQTGQPVKRQWDPTKNQWVNVGGKKADENGIVIENADGTRTIIGGSGGAKTTEADRRAKLLIDQIVQQEAPLMQAFDSLATGQNTVGSATGAAGRAFMTADGQNADDALTNVVANWLYLTSGATATDAEVARQVAMIKPTALDKPENIATKKARLGYIFETMKMRSGMPTNPVAPAAPSAPKPPVTINGYTIQEIP